MPVEDDAAAAVAAILAGQPRNISYPEYTTKEDFTLWLSGFVARVRSEYGFKLDENDKLEKEIIRSISGKLSVGSALDAYNRLSYDDKTDYDRLIARLTEEYTDPRAKKKFNARLHYNIRKKHQSLKDFMQDIIKDMGRYSYVQPTIIDATRNVIPNPERETQGVRRFVEGMRDEKGRIDEDFKRHLEYHLQDEKEMTWANAIKVASRYETVTNASKEEDGSSDDANSEEAKAAESEKKTKVKKGKVTISALADQVEENQERIAKIESALDRMAAAQEQLAVAQEATNAMMQEMLAKFDVLFPVAQNGFRSY